MGCIVRVSILFYSVELHAEGEGGTLYNTTHTTQTMHACALGTPVKGVVARGYLWCTPSTS